MLLGSERIARFALVVSVVSAGALAATADEAAADDCVETDPAEMLEDADVAFIGEQIDETEEGTQTYRVDRWLGSEPAVETIEMHDGWGYSHLGEGVRVFLGWRDPDGELQPSVCSNAWDPFVAELVIDGLPTPKAIGEPAFVIATRQMAGLVGAVLNDAGEVLHYAPGEGELLAFAACPGGELVAAVRTDSADPVYGYPTDSTWWIDVRAAADLALVASWEVTDVDWFERDGQGLVDPECHTSDASIVTALAPQWTYNDNAAANVATSGDAILVRDQMLERYEVAWPRDVTFDVATDTLHVIADELGRRISSFPRDGRPVVRELPGTHAAFHLDVHDDRWEIVTRSAPLGLPNRHWGAVDHVLSGPFEDLEQVRLPVSDASARVTSIHATPSTRWALVGVPGDTSLLVDLGDPTTWVSLDLEGFRTIVIGDRFTMVDGVRAAAHFQMAGVDGPATITHLRGGRAAAAIHPTTATLAEVAARTSEPSAPPAIYPPTQPSEPPATYQPSDPAAAAEASAAPPSTERAEERTATAAWFVVIGVSLIIVAAVAGRRALRSP